MSHPQDTANPELTILIASFNARATIQACLDSLRGQRKARESRSFFGRILQFITPMRKGGGSC